MRLLAVLLLLLLGSGAYIGQLFWGDLTLRQSPLEFDIAPGSGLRSVARTINAAGVDVPVWALELAGRYKGVDLAIKPGSYEITQGITLWGLIDKLARGDISQSEILIIEGWNWPLVRNRLAARQDLRHDSAALSDAELRARLGISEASLEGWLFPDTYRVPRRSSDLEFLERASRAMRRHLEREWAQRAPGLPYTTPYQALIMASVIEKETGRDTERAQIAAVFVNRLRRGMLLQTDPSVIYGLGERFDGNLRKRDLLEDTPYNSYTRAGLPPTPIAMPGLASLRAALHPAASDALYFVARGDGSSQFSRSLDEHNQAVFRYQKSPRAAQKDKP